jgi:predicted nucleotidyltransferase
MDYSSLLFTLRNELMNLLQDNLVGIYVYGSIAFRCYNENKSDIDLVVVIDKQVNYEIKVKIVKIVQNLEPKGPPKGFKLNLMLRRNTEHFVYPTPYEMYYSKQNYKDFILNPEKVCGDTPKFDYNLAIDFTIIYNYGVVIYGEPVRYVFDDVNSDYFVQNIEYVVEQATNRIKTKPVSTILNLCRALAYLEDGLILSKDQGGMWALKSIDRNYWPLIKFTLQEYRSDEVANKFFGNEIDFLQYMTSEINNEINTRKM